MFAGYNVAMAGLPTTALWQLLWFVIRLILQHHGRYDAVVYADTALGPLITTLNLHPAPCSHLRGAWIRLYGSTGGQWGWHPAAVHTRAPRSCKPFLGAVRCTGRHELPMGVLPGYLEQASHWPEPAHGEGALHTEQPEVARSGVPLLRCEADLLGAVACWLCAVVPAGEGSWPLVPWDREAAAV